MSDDTETTVLAAVMARWAAHNLTFVPGQADGIWLGQCPVHKDTHITIECDEYADDGAVVWPCPRGCTPAETIRQLGLETATPEPGYQAMADRAQKAKYGGDGAEDQYLRVVAALIAQDYGSRRSDHAGNGEGRYGCPCCGAAGDGHGLKVNRGDTQPVVMTCFSCKAPIGEFLAKLGLTQADVTRPIDGFDDWLDSAGDTSTSPVDTPEAEQIWDHDPILGQIRDFARSRIVSPWALLGVALVRASCTIAPWVTIPPMIGSRASLNMFVALVGPSGTGKGAAEGAGRELLPARDLFGVPLFEFTPGSGEGVSRVYRKRARVKEPDGSYTDTFEEVRNRAICSVPELDLIAKLGGRQGSTLWPVLRSAWSGERLGNQNADPEKTVPVEAHTYRLGLTLGVQPKRAHQLLNEEEEAGGTPQRFLWLPTLDPDAPDVAEAVDVPEIKPGVVGKHIVLPDSVIGAVKEAGRQRLRGDVEALDGHRTLTWLKTTIALVVLCGRDTVTEADWAAAALIMAKSDATRAWVQGQLLEDVKRRNHDEAVRAGVFDDTKADVVETRSYKRVEKRVLKLLTDGEMARGDLRNAMASRDRGAFDVVIEDMVRAGCIRRRTETAGNSKEAVFYGLP